MKEFTKTKAKKKKTLSLIKTKVNSNKKYTYKKLILSQIVIKISYFHFNLMY